jgi:hypothetical protein
MPATRKLTAEQKNEMKIKLLASKGVRVAEIER